MGGSDEHQRVSVGNIDDHGSDDLAVVSRMETDGASIRQATLGPSTRRTGGGPRLALAEWAALIAINRAHSEDAAALAAALANASKCLTRIAASAGSARPGTKLRSVGGLRRRLTVVRALEVGGITGLPAEARAAWALFANQPAEAMRLVREILKQNQSEEPLAAVIPSRGPTPRLGSLISNHEDGENCVYVMRLVGPAASLLYEGSRSLVVVKVGRSSDPARRRDELSWGLPPGCGLEWQLDHDRVFPSAAAAHVFEQALLARLYASGKTIGGEYARVTKEEVAGLLNRDSDDSAGAA